MSFKKSNDSIEKNKLKWTGNLPKTPPRNAEVPLVKSITEFSKIPKNRDILGYFNFLIRRVRSRSDRVKLIIKDVEELWKKLDFPILSPASIRKRLNYLIDKLKNYRKRPTREFQELLPLLFDVTCVKGQWLSAEDKRLYELQIQTCGRVGYTTRKIAPKSSIHPRRRIRIMRSQTNPVSQFTLEDTGSDQTVDIDSDSSSYASSKCAMKPSRSSTTAATALVRKKNLSTNKTYNVLQTLSAEGLDVPVPSQSGIWRRVMREGEQMTDKIRNFLGKNEFCLHFDGKRLDGEEYQVVILQSETCQLNLGVLRCKSGSAKEIFGEIKKTLDQFDAWKNIAMIICDTTNVNTGCRNGVVKQIQQSILNFGFLKAQYIGCQHHVLDLLIRHVLDHAVDESSASPLLPYTFIKTIEKEYSSLQILYDEAATGVPETNGENRGWRDDFRFLFELCQAFQHYQVSCKLKNWITDMSMIVQH